MFTEYVFENRNYDIALRDVKSILFDIVMSEQEKVTAIISKVRTTGDEKLQEKLITLCNEQGECLRNLLEISNSFSENLQLLDSYSRELKKIENKNIANIITGMRKEKKRTKKQSQNEEEIQNQENQAQELNPEQPPVMNPGQPPVMNPEQPPVMNPEQPPVMNPEQPPVMNPEQPPVMNPEQATANNGNANVPPNIKPGKITFKRIMGPGDANITPPAAPATSEPQPAPEAQQAPAPTASETPKEEPKNETTNKENAAPTSNGESNLPPNIKPGKITFKRIMGPEDANATPPAAPATPAPTPNTEEKKEEPKTEEIVNDNSQQEEPKKIEEIKEEKPIEENKTEETNNETPTLEEKQEEILEEPVEETQEVRKPLLPLIPEEPAPENTPSDAALAAPITNTPTEETSVIPPQPVDNNNAQSQVLAIPKVESVQTNSSQSTMTHFKKDNTDETKAILTSAKQIESLRQSLQTQEPLMGSFLNNNTANAMATVSNEQLENQLVQNGLLPADNANIQAQIEQKMAEANKLYTEGKTEEAQALYSEISALSKNLNQNVIPTITK